MLEKSIFGIIFVFPLVAAAIIDLKKRDIPDICCAALFLLGTVRMLCGQSSFLSAIQGLLFCGIPLLIISLLMNGFGGGDIKLIAGAGYFLGLNGAEMLLFSSLFLFLCAAGILKLSNRLKEKKALPFGPFIAAGALLSYTFIFTGVIAN